MPSPPDRTPPTSSLILRPPTFAISLAVAAAARSPCAKSRRGSVIFDDETLVSIGVGFNGPPSPLRCTANDACRQNCREHCEHAETRSLFQALPRQSEFKSRHPRINLVHTKVDATGKLVAGGGPSCHRCSRTLLDTRFVDYVWLYQAIPEDYCPQIPTEPRVRCPYCQGQACLPCTIIQQDPYTVDCQHDVSDRHQGLTAVEGIWHRYSTLEFHVTSLRSNHMPVPR